MFQSAFTSPSLDATRVGHELLEDGAHAVEAMVAAAAAIAVSYPHMNSVGGDGFWLILPAAGEPVGILAGGRSGHRVGRHCWAEQRAERGVDAMLTVPGAVAGWQAALDWLQTSGSTPRPVSELMTPAATLAGSTATVSSSLARNLAEREAELRDVPGFTERFLAGGLPTPGDPQTNADLASLLDRLGVAGLDDFYRGDVGRHLATQLSSLGSVLDGDDLADCRAQRVSPLHVDLGADRVFNLPAPTQGAASLMILALYHRLRRDAPGEADHVHLLVEATKQAFELRDRHIGDPQSTTLDYDAVFSDAGIASLARDISLERAAAWPRADGPADTVWLGAMDRSGNMVSYIQSLYWEFGSGVVIPGTGMLWTNRGLCFDDADAGPNAIAPQRVPRHTLNPAAACFGDGRRMVYGTMGGEGQPQTQGAIWWRYAVSGLDPETTIAAPRWLLGRTWGEESASLKIERTLATRIGDALASRGHVVEAVDDANENMGHAGMIVRHEDGRAEAASDPRSDGGVRVGAEPVVD